MTRVVAVFGYSPLRGNDLHDVCAARLDRAHELARDADAVILSGFARGRRERSEAELMRDAWEHEHVEVVLDDDARSTADNARNIVAAARRLHANELVAVTSWWHRPRALVLLRAAARGTGMRVSVQSASGPRPVALAARELVAMLGLPLQWRRATNR